MARHRALRIGRVFEVILFTWMLAQTLGIILRVALQLRQLLACRCFPYAHGLVFAATGQLCAI